MIRFWAYILTFVLLSCNMSAQGLQKVTFIHNTKPLTDELWSGQRIKIFVSDQSGRISSHRGKLQDMRNDSIFLRKLGRIDGYALSEVEEIRYRTRPIQGLLRFCLWGGLALLIISAGLLFPIILAGESTALIEFTTYTGMGLLLLAGPIAVLSKRWIEKPAINRQVEVSREVEAYHIP